MTPHRVRMPPLWLPPMVSHLLGWQPAAAQYVDSVTSSSVSSDSSCGEAFGLEAGTGSSLLVLQHSLPKETPGVEPCMNATDWLPRLQVGSVTATLVWVRTKSVTGTTVPLGMILLPVLILIGLAMAFWFFAMSIQTKSKTHASGPALKSGTNGGTEQLLSRSGTSSHIGEPWSRDVPQPRSSTGRLPSEQQAQAKIPFPRRSGTGINVPPSRPSAKKVMVPSLPLAQLNQQNNPEPLPPEFLQTTSPPASTPTSSINGLECIERQESSCQNTNPGPSIKTLLRCLDRDEGLPDGPGTGYYSRSSQPASSAYVVGSFDPGPRSASSTAGAAVPVFTGRGEVANQEVPRLIDGFECHPDARELGGLSPPTDIVHSEAKNSSTQRLVKFSD